MFHWKKVLLTTCLSGAILSAGSMPLAPAVAYGAEPMVAVAEAETTALEPKAEETEWKYRVVDGRLQKRLWSATWGKWLTEWEWVN